MEGLRGALRAQMSVSTMLLQFYRLEHNLDTTPSALLTHSLSIIGIVPFSC